MARPSLSASQVGIQAAKQALTQAGLTQKDLCDRVGCSRQPVTNFFKGQAIVQELFIRICDNLNLDWRAIAESLATPIVATPEPTLVEPNGIDPVVQLRQKVYDSIQERCGTMRVLDMSHPIGVDEIYTSVNILEQITGRRHKRIDELLAAYEAEDFERFGLNKVTEERVPGLEAVQKYKKLIILGKPGAGKTTFLKYLAIRCNEGSFEAKRLPIFITLKNFAEADDESSLLEYISRRDLNHYIPSLSTPVEDQWISAYYTLLSQGRGLVLLDGLDEVREEDHDRVLKEIRDFSEQFRDNHFVITCRIAAWEYTFEKFTEVEIADFDKPQIVIFAKQWFKDKPIQPEAFIRCLEKNHRIQELAFSPLLLTLLCLAFEESGNCPSNRSELYKEGIDALLKKWDAKRGIQRDQIYKNLSHQRKEDLLSYLALATFQRKDYFFKQQVIEQHITDYIRNLPYASPDPDLLQLDSEVILRAIEAQHGLLVERAKGIYSFSHLTFQEYLTAREIVFNAKRLEDALQELSCHLTDRRWHEVFLLATEMLRDAALLLSPMKQKTDALLASHPRLQDFLQDVVEQAADPAYAFCKPAAVRAFFFDVDFDIDEHRRVALSLDRAANLFVCASFLTRMLKGITLQEAIAIAQQHDAQTPEQSMTAATSADEVMIIAIQIALASKRLDPGERKTLKTLVQQLNEQDEETMKEVADEARDVAKTRHHIGQKWRFSAEEKELLKQYYYANQLLVECLTSDGCMMSPEVRHEIETSLLLPMSFN